MKISKVLDISQSRITVTMSIDLENDETNFSESEAVAQNGEILAHVNPLQGLEKYVIGRLDELEGKIKDGKLIEAKFAEWEIIEDDAIDSPNGAESSVTMRRCRCTRCGRIEYSEPEYAGRYCCDCGSRMKVRKSAAPEREKDAKAN